MNDLCPCGSKKKYSSCCELLHEGALAKDALELMKSRYSAYCMDRPDYIIKTTHRKNPHYRTDKKQWAEDIVNSCRTIQFKKLEINDFKDGPKKAYVSFEVAYRQNGLDYKLIETSSFLKDHDQWLYLDGDFRVEPIS